ncbi:MAG: YkgJ family cysteine cluster protein [bacterium]|nr:YkgJ family cysteine cluster protein [bacterium]
MKPTFEYPRDVRYSCIQCGDGCRTWSVMLGPGERESIAALDWEGREEELMGIRPAVRVKVPGTAERFRLARREDGSCVYLGSDNLCRIHQHFGPEAKPLMCRLYPFGFYPVGDRIAVDCSFTCRALSQGLGPDLKTRLPEWTRLLSESDTRDRRQHRLTARMLIGGELVWEFEHYLLRFLEDRSMCLFDRIRCVLQFMRIATTGDPTHESAAKLREAMAKGIPIQLAKTPPRGTMDKTQRAIFFQWLYLALNPPHPDLVRRPRPRQEAEQARRVKAGNRYRQPQGRPWVDNREIGVSFAEIARVGGDLFGGDGTAPLDTFLRAKIIGQKFMIADEKELPLVEAVPRFLLCFPMTIWTAKALAADRGAPEVEEADVREAVRLIDRTLGQMAISSLPRKQAKACEFILLETDLVEAAANDLLNKTMSDGVYDGTRR